MRNVSELWKKVDNVKNYDKRLKALEDTKRIEKDNAAFTERVKKVERLFEAMTEEYNSEQAQRERAAEYAEIQRIGELRKQAFLNGESMDKYPLPFEKTEFELPEELKRFIPSTGAYKEKE